MRNVTQEMEILRKKNNNKMLVINIFVTEMKSVFNVLISRLDPVEEGIFKLKSINRILENQKAKRTKTK